MDGETRGYLWTISQKKPAPAAKDEGSRVAQKKAAGQRNQSNAAGTNNPNNSNQQQWSSVAVSRPSQQSTVAERSPARIVGSGGAGTTRQVPVARAPAPAYSAATSRQTSATHASSRQTSGTRTEMVMVMVNVDL